MSVLRFIAGLLLSTLIASLLLARFAVEIIGASTAPDDFALLMQRIPVVLSWLFSTPWPVPAALLIGLSAFAGWLLMSGTKKATAEEIADHPGLSEEAITSLIDHRLPSLDDYAKHSHLHDHDVKLADLADKIKSVRALAEGGHEAVEARFKQIEDKLDRLIAYAEQRTGELSDRFANVDAGFAAILNREWHRNLFDGLEADFAKISKPIDAGQGIKDNDLWQDKVKQWRGSLDHWLMLADFYAMGTRETVLLIPDHLYDSNWTFDEAPLTANQVHRFKEASIWWMSAKAAKPRVENCLVAAAFQSPSKKGRLDSPPRPSASQ